jgi:hypothetical protein
MCTICICNRKARPKSHCSERALSSNGIVRSEGVAVVPFLVAVCLEIKTGLYGICF